MAKDGDDQKKRSPGPPMRQIMTSLPFLVVCIAMMGKFWGYYTIIAGIPQYFLAIHNVSLEKVKFQISIFNTAFLAKGWINEDWDEKIHEVNRYLSIYRDYFIKKQCHINKALDLTLKSYFRMASSLPFLMCVELLQWFHQEKCPISWFQGSSCPIWDRKNCLAGLAVTALL